MNTFAGFWRDGAVVKPGERHVDSRGYVVTQHKMSGIFGARATHVNFDDWYWLDTTTPTELTPQEAFELLKTITPTLERIEKQGNLYSAYADERISIINWGSATEYPPRERWRVPTDADKGAKCRCWDRTGGFRDEGRFVAVFDDGFLTTGSRGFYVWDHCEVLE